VGIMNVLLDANPDAVVLPRKKVKLRIPRPKDALTSLTAGFVDSYSDIVKRILSAMTDLLTMAERAAATGASVDPKEFAALFPEITAFTERLRFNILYRGPQKFACTEVPLAEVKAIKQQCGTSVNDVILAIVTSTVRRYCELHGERVKGRLFRMMVPVNLRESVITSELGNRISLVPVTVPLDIHDPRRLLAAVHKRTEFLKRMHAAELVSLAGGLIGLFPTSLQGLAGPLASQLPVTPFNLVCTNVPGPQFPLYLLGHKMIDWYPYVPVGGEMAVNCAILSYNGKVYFGFSGDVHAAPDLNRMEKLLLLSFNELREAVGLTQPKIKRSVKRRVAPVGAAKKSNTAKTVKTVKTVKAEPPHVPPISSASQTNTKRQPEPAPMTAPRNAMPEYVIA
jgi:diacylglycerol O-acyltransferase / wax synthase